MIKSRASDHFQAYVRAERHTHTHHKPYKHIHLLWIYAVDIHHLSLNKTHGDHFHAYVCAERHTHIIQALQAFILAVDIHHLSLNKTRGDHFRAYVHESSTWCWVIEKGGKKILVGVIYRSTSSTRENDEMLLKQMVRANEIAGDNRILIMGDFNGPGISWDELDTKRGAKRIDREMLDTVTDCFWYQHVKEDTWFRNEQSSLLDLVFTKEENDVRNIVHLPPLGKSDHEMVTGDFVTEWRSKIVQKPRRMYHKGNFNKINEELALVDWVNLFEDKSVQVKNWLRNMSQSQPQRTTMNHG